MLEYEPSLKVTAVDINKNRMQRLKDNLKRQNLSADILIADVKNTKNWWDEQRFDRILLDAPCSGTGVIRRHPDIKVLRTYDEVLTSIEIQKQLLQSLWNCLRSGGLLLYTTCSILQEENQLQIRDFLKSTNTAKCESIEIEWGVECKYGRQFLPEVPTNNQNPDGFFFSLLRKT
jgi:16S rRNA (cytosine967-C5)-methyltransferase